MKKQCIALNILLLVTFSPQSQGAQGTIEQSLKNDFNKAQQTIANNFTNAFMGVSVSGLVKNALGQQNLLNCCTSITALEPLIEKYSADYLYRPDATLMAIMSEVGQACSNLTSIALTTGKLLGQGDYAAVSSQLSQFQALQDKMLDLIKRLESTNYYLFGKKECNRMLIYAATVIESSANRAQKDFTKEFIQKAPVGFKSQQSGAGALKEFILKK